MSERYRPNLRDTLRNWTYSDLPFWRKVGVTAKNEWIKIRTLRECCGHIDEPGC